MTYNEWHAKNERIGDTMDTNVTTMSDSKIIERSGDGVYYTATVRPMTAYKVDGDVRTDYDNVDAEDIARDGDFVSEFGTIGELFVELGKWHAENPAHMDGHAAVGHEVVVTRWDGPAENRPRPCRYVPRPNNT